MIGTVLGERYKLIEKVGLGGMAVVYKAEDQLLRREVAVKILKDHFSEDSEFSDKFEIEAQSAASLSHPNIVSIYDVGSEYINDNHVQYIVMELIKGKTLKQIIVERGTISNEDTVDYSIQIAEALRAAHKNNIIHRDIKPQNIMITDEGMAKVTDFGIARISTAATITYTSSILGTVHYISPEQAKGKFINYKSDIYSLGIVMYEMVTGRVPFDAENSVGIALKHIQDEVVEPKEINPDVSDKLNDIILKCLEKNPDDRFTNADALIKALKSKDILLVSDISKTELIQKPILKEEPVSKYETHNEYDTEEEPKKNTLRNIFITILLAIFSVTIGFFIFTNVKENMAGDKIIVPDLINKSEEEAISTLKDANLNYNIIRKVNENIHQGFVFDQDPKKGEEVSEKAYIEIVVSEGVKEKTMPNLVNLDIEEARNVLRAEGLSIASEKHAESSEPEGTVIEQEPANGASIGEQTPISLTISLGEAVKEVTMPSLLGSSQSAAVSALVDNGLIVGKIDRMFSDDYPSGTVMWQSYDEGVKLNLETSIDLIISRGSKKDTDFELPEGTIDLTNGAEDGDMKLYTFSIEPPANKDEFNLKIYRHYNGEEELVYESNHSTESKFDMNFKDYTNSDFSIYYDDVKVASTN